MCVCIIISSYIPAVQEEESIKKMVVGFPMCVCVGQRKATVCALYDRVVCVCVCVIER